MKRFLTLILICAFSVQALSWSAQIKVEWLFDTYRERFLTPFGPEKQVETLKKIDIALSQYKNRTTVSPSWREIVSYLQHLLCHAQSLITGYYCQDKYHPESLLTTNKKNLTLSQIRDLLIAEHTLRRVERSMGGLIQSEKLNAIAQKYALELCKAWEITHTLNGSTLEKRYRDGQYDYTWWGENLGLGQENIMEILDQLTTSIGHRKNMYQPEFREIGVGQCDTIWVLNYGTLDME
jgi:uncharacterized protein YkwD